MVDCFPFFNEVELLEFRFELLWDVVDTFVIAEATRTHSGQPKPLYFDPVRYAKYMSKVVRVIVDDFPETTDAWVRERFQRDALTRGLNLDSEDLIVLSDLDELPNPDLLSNLRTTGVPEPCSLGSYFYYYNFKTRYTGGDTAWTQSKVCTFGQFQSIGCTLSQLRARPCPVLPNGGWHCSYFGSADRIRHKIQNFAHQEFNSDAYTNLDTIQDRMQNHRDVYGRSYATFEHVEYDPGSPAVPPRSELLLSLFKPPIQ